MPDFFISYNHADTHWAAWIAWELEQVGYSVVIQTRDFGPGSNFVLEMQKVVSEATQTIAVLSPDYLRAEFTQPEWAAAFAEDPTGKARRLLPVRVRDCELHGLLKPIVHIDLVGLEEGAARRTLLDGVSRNRRPGTAPRFPAAKAPRFPGALPDIWNVPHLRNPNFTGREDLLLALRAALTSGRPAALTQAISGLGGVGKTQLAVEYAYRNSGSYALVWWVRAEEPVTLLRDYAELAARLGLREKREEDRSQAVTEARNWLSHNDGWLLILDNAHEVASCREFMPYGSTGHIIITSRNPNWKIIAEQLPVKSLRREEGTAFLLRRTGQQDREAATSLSEELGDLPLALEQAAAYMDASQIEIRRYLGLLRAYSKELLGPVALTWTLTLERLQEKDTKALELMNLFGFLAPEEIPRELARKITGSALVLAETVAALRRFSLIEVNSHGFTVHRLVQAAARERLRAMGEEAAWAEKTIQSLYQLRDWAGTTRLFPHALVAAGHSERLNVALETTTRILRDVGMFLAERGQLSPARQALERALVTAEKVFGPDDPEVATLADLLARVYSEQGNLPKAQELTRRALDIEITSFGPTHRRVAITARDLGRILASAGDLNGAIRYARQALEIDEKVYGASHPKIAVLANELSNILHESGDPSGALVYAQRALGIDENSYGPQHSQTAMDENDVGVICEDLGNVVEAEHRYQRAIDVLTKTYGPEHALTKQVAENLSDVRGLISERRP